MHHHDTVMPNPTLASSPDTAHREVAELVGVPSTGHRNTE
jgi:hypothetical protein